VGVGASTGAETEADSSRNESSGLLEMSSSGIKSGPVEIPKPRVVDDEAKGGCCCSCCCSEVREDMERLEY
jgi:hypothetical protein